MNTMAIKERLTIDISIHSKICPEYSEYINHAIINDLNSHHNHNKLTINA